jgi:hypothetical protein
LLSVAFFIFACSEEIEPPTQDVPEISARQEEKTEDIFVSSNQAADVANAFFRKQTGSTMLKSSMMNASVEAVAEEGNPLMYVVNYPEGGWAIISATKNYHPVLAHSDKGSFEIKPEMGGVAIWLDQAKEAVKKSHLLPDSAKIAMRTAWLPFESKKESAPARSKSMLKSGTYDEQAAAFNARKEALYAQYPVGWYFCSLYDASSYLTQYNYEIACENAYEYGSPLEFTIVGIKTVSSYTETAPLLTTIWHQDTPYNDYSPNSSPAGCAAIAMAQVMNYHQRPSYINYDGHVVDWNNMPSYEDEDTSYPNSSAPYLVRVAGMISGTNYWHWFSWAMPGNVVDGLRDQGYTVQRRDPGIVNGVEGQIRQGNPVIMVGFPRLSTNGHYWVCDRYKQFLDSEYYFVEYLTYSNNYDSMPGNPWDGNPATNYSYGWTQYYMNWGWAGQHNGWYSNLHPTPSDYNFSYNREDFYIF